MHMWDRKIHPRVYTTPYPSSLTAVRAGKNPRQTLVSFIGNTNHGDVPVRSQIGRWCEQYQNHKLVCSRPVHMEEVIRLKEEAVFCLEPVGDSVGRKSVSDSYGCGCIPVFFGPAQAFQYPIQWAGWYDAAFVILDRLLFINGTLDPVEVLSRIPSQQVKQIQGNIARHGSKMLYSTDDFEAWARLRMRSVSKNLVGFAAPRAGSVHCASQFLFFTYTLYWDL